MNTSEFRDEIYRNIYNMKPSWWMRWGIGVIFLIFLALLILSHFIRYSDIITAEVRFTSNTPSVTLPALTSERIFSIKTSDGGHVAKDDYLLIFRNNANEIHIKAVEDILSRVKSTNDYLPFFEDVRNSRYILGDIQTEWTALLNDLYQYYEIVELKKFEKNISRLEHELELHSNADDYWDAILGINASMQQLAKNNFQIDSTLHASGTTSNAEFNTSLERYLDKQKSIEVQRLSYNQNRLEIIKLKNSIQNLRETKAQELQSICLHISQALSQLKSSLALWEQQFVLKSPIDGSVNYLVPLKENLFVNQGTSLITITPDKKTYIGLLQIPFSGAGKVNVGQSVNIKLDDYPYYEFGFMKAKVGKISKVATQDFYTGEVTLENASRTHYDKPIIIHENAKGVAEIVSRKRSLLTRIFDKILYIFNK